MVGESRNCFLRLRGQFLGRGTRRRVRWTLSWNHFGGRSAFPRRL